MCFDSDGVRARLCLQKDPGNVRGVFGSERKLELGCKVVFSLSLFLGIFETAYVVWSVSRPCLVLGKLAYQVLNKYQSI